jgi:hypothetical protein
VFGGGSCLHYQGKRLTKKESGIYGEERQTMAVCENVETSVLFVKGI